MVFEGAIDKAPAMEEPTAVVDPGLAIVEVEVVELGSITVVVVDSVNDN